MKRLMLYLNKSKKEAVAAAAQCIKLCRSYGFEPVLFPEDVSLLRPFLSETEEGISVLSQPDASIQYITTFGGDGTVLTALDRFSEMDIPILTVNLGRMGFLLETKTEELSQALEQLACENYEIEHRMMLKMQGKVGQQEIGGIATNEVAISRGLSQRMIALDVFSDGSFVDHYIADGVVVASPTGSTGYSLSAGGPIVAPDVNCMIINPICPHMLQSRPIVVSPRSQIMLVLHMLESREGIRLSIDGKDICEMANGDSVLITRSEHDALLIRFPRERNYFSLLKDKLSQWIL